jgi:uncharacterized surface protein with fasciclin (FAS1) repeats
MEGDSQMADIVTTAQQSGQLSTLVTALQVADLVESLKSSGPFTLFAPTDNAFSQVPQDIINNLLQNTDQLKQVLLYHVIPGEYLAEDVMDNDQLETAEGEEITIDTSRGDVMIDNAKLVQADINCDNGVIHIIDNVLVPSRVRAGIR